jgi:hypothetical protein
MDPRGAPRIYCDDLLAQDVGRFYSDPLGFVLWSWPWDSEGFRGLVRLPKKWAKKYGVEFGPDEWACELLAEIGAGVKDRRFSGSSPVAPQRHAIASGHGIGKSCLLAWIVTWIMATRPRSQGTVTANTMSQLQSKTWAQIERWLSSSLVAHWFDISRGRGSMRLSGKAAPSEWFCTAQTCREENAEAFAGQHAPTATSFYIFDEASAIPDRIWDVAEGGLTDGEPMFFAFGNPTRNTGRFKDLFGKHRHLWGNRQIDSRSVQLTNKESIQEWVDTYGEDSDFVKVRVRGLFPALSALQLISESDVDAAYGRVVHGHQYEFAAKIISCDPAWEGNDELVIGLRQGLAFQILRTTGKNDNDLQVAMMIAALEDEHKADAVVIDLGFGTGIVSAGRTLGRNWRGVWFSEASPDHGCLNMRAYMWREMRDWLKSGGCIPEDPVLRADLLGPEVVARMDGKLQLEAKKDMKKRGLPSPGRGDALALTFGVNVKSHRQHRGLNTILADKQKDWSPHDYL